MSRFINPVPQYLNSAGDPIVAGQMFFYEVGSTTPKDVYLDAALTIPAANPVFLNADGRMPDTYLLGSYRTILSEPSTGEQWERDNVGSETTEGYGSGWNSTVTYNVPDVVLFDGKYYQSLTNNNIGNTPDSSASNWQLISAVGYGTPWNNGAEYSSSDVVLFGGVYYQSTTDGNTGNTPGPNSDEWESIYLGSVAPNILDNSNFQIRQRGDSDTTGNGGTFFDRWGTAPTSATGGTTELAYEGEADYDDEHWVKVTAAGHTAPWYMTQKWLIANGRITAGENYTFTASTEVLSAPIKAKVFIRGYDVSAGTNYTLAEGNIDLDSNQNVSITLTPVHQQGSALTAEGDYFEVGFTGEGANNGSDFVLPDGSYRFKTLKLEKGSVYTGDEPTPYAQDELECMKWYQEISGRWTGYPQLNSSTNFLRAADVNFPVGMYFTPAVTVDASSAWTPTFTAYKSTIRASGTPLSGNSGTSINGYTASCEL